MRTGTMDEPGPEGDGLTPVRRRIVRVIGESMRNRGYSPSMREIGDAVGLASTSSVSHQLSVLQAKGYLIREPGRPRTMILRLPGQDDATMEASELPEGVTEVPLVGRIAAGTPVLADELLEDVVPLPRMLVGNGDGLIMLKVAGDSMIGAAIADGDWVVVHRQPDAESGDIVAAMLESDGSSDGEATVKTLKKADGHTWLIPHNPAYSPIMADSAVIIGKVVSVLRRLLARARAYDITRHDFRDITGDPPKDAPHLLCPVLCFMKTAHGMSSLDFYAWQARAAARDQGAFGGESANSSSPCR